MIYRILISFALGALLTLLITSINYRRDHYKEIKQIFTDAVRDVAKCASEYWLSNYDDKNAAALQGAIIYLQHILPVSSNILDQDETTKLKSEFGDLADKALGREDLHKDTHKPDRKRVAEIHTICAAYLSGYHTLYLEKMGLWNLVRRYLVELQRTFCDKITKQ